MINGLTIAWMTWANHRDKLNQLYEQGVSEKDISRYVEWWKRWVQSGVEVVAFCLGNTGRIPVNIQPKAD
ncbi:MAG: hypothetical protein D3916_02315 [Candidatus Electrothrix sp. MAN1_4]|nr:hypothetical protein [Candidatus Electrothrix sp. MAN1_4]